MNYVKQILTTLFLALLVASCSDDTITETDDDGNGDLTPNSKIVITTEVNGNVENTKTIELIDDSFVPSSATISGSYNELNNMFVVNFSDIENSIPKFTVGFSARMQEYKEGSYSFSQGDGNFIVGSYMNKEYNDKQYLATSVELNLTELKYLGQSNLGSYYTTGDITMELENGDEKITVKIAIESAPIAYTGNVSAKK